MSEQLRESLSAAMDDEADAFELRRVLDEAKADADLREQWYRFHVVRDALSSGTEHYRPELRERIWAALNEPEADGDVAELVLTEPGDGPAHARNPWWGRATGAAVAATVAAVVVLSAGLFEEEEAPQVATRNATPALEGSAALVPVMHQQIHAADRQRHNGFVLHHYQQKAMNTSGVGAFVKLATFRNTPRDMRPLVETPAAEGDQAAP